MELSMCGYRCDLCKVFAPNVMKNDKRKEQIQAWQKYCGGFEEVTPENTYCEGCRCDKPDAKRLDMECPVRKCVAKKGFDNCGCCKDYPCKISDLKKGLCFEDAKNKSGDKFDAGEYEEYLRAFDNEKRLNTYLLDTIR